MNFLNKFLGSDNKNKDKEHNSRISFSNASSLSSLNDSPNYASKSSFNVSPISSRRNSSKSSFNVFPISRRKSSKSSFNVSPISSRKNSKYSSSENDLSSVSSENSLFNLSPMIRSNSSFVSPYSSYGSNDSSDLYDSDTYYGSSNSLSSYDKKPGLLYAGIPIRTSTNDIHDYPNKGFGRNFSYPGFTRSKGSDDLTGGYIKRYKSKKRTKKRKRTKTKSRSRSRYRTRSYKKRK